MAEELWPKLNEYNPNLTKEDWKEIIKDPSIFDEKVFYTFAALLEAKEPSCHSIEEEFHVNKWGMNSFNLISANIRSLGQNVSKRKNIPLYSRPSNQKDAFWCISCQGYRNDENHFVFKVRDELREAFVETNVLEEYAKMLHARLWAGGCIWDELDKKQEFIANHYWQNGWDESDSKTPAVKSWQAFHEIKKYDLLTFKGYGGSNDLTIYEVGEVISKDDSTGKIFIKPLPDIPKYHGKAPKMAKEGWFGTLFEVTGKNAIDSILRLHRESEMEKQENSKYVELLKDNKNLILHGAPGTGKTFLAKQIAEAMGCSKDEIGFCQFHPSYDYTDFVEGLRPAKNNGFERKDGIFKSFCKKALQNVIDSNKSVTQIQTEFSWQEKIKVFLDDAIENGTECPLKKNGCVIIESYHDDIVEISLPGNESHKGDIIHISKLLTVLSADQSFESAIEIERYLKGFHSAEYSYILAVYKKIREYSFDSKLTVNTVSKVEPKKYIFIIDEINRGELSKIFGELFFSIDPGYRGEEGRVNTQYQNLIEDDFFKDGFYIPDNVYIIGTMNDIDRSVESMDFAMRRRFTFVEVTTEESAKNMNITGEALKKMTAINKAITKMPELGKSYCIGAAYFKDADDMKKLWDLKISSLVYEYLRGIDSYTDEHKDGEKLDKIKSAYDNPDSIA